MRKNDHQTDQKTQNPPRHQPEAEETKPLIAKRINGAALATVFFNNLSHKPTLLWHSAHGILIIVDATTDQDITAINDMEREVQMLKHNALNPYIVATKHAVPYHPGAIR